MAATIEKNISSAKLASKVDLRNRKGKFASIKNVTKGACSTGKLNDGEAHEINEIIPRK